MNQFQKFLHEIGEREKTDFSLKQFFGSGHFLIHDILKNGPINDRSKKSQNSKKITHFMPVNLA